MDQATSPSPVTFEVELLPSGHVYRAPADIPLLRAAALAGYKLPSLCRKGTCRACMCQAFDGQVRYAVERPGLSEDEQADGWILPCVAHAVSDLILDAPGARVLDPTPPRPIQVGPR